MKIKNRINILLLILVIIGISLYVYSNNNNNNTNNGYLPVTYMYTNKEGNTEFKKLKYKMYKLKGQGSKGAFSKIMKKRDVQFGITHKSKEGKKVKLKHNAPRRQLVLTLNGSILLKNVCPKNNKCRKESYLFGPGDILLADDITGVGHEWTMTSSPWIRCYIHLTDNEFKELMKSMSI